MDTDHPIRPLPGDHRARVRRLHPAQMRTAVAVVAAGMRDNPIHVAAYGADPHKRQVQHGRLIGGLLRVSPLTLTGVTRGDALVAVMGEAPPGVCRLTVRQRLRIGPTLVGMGPDSVARVLRWNRAWSSHDPAEPHVHLGPVAVDPRLQGQGLGTLLLREHCRRLDERQLLGHLETDKPVNVEFYRRFGYQVAERAQVLGVPTWFMRREPAPCHTASLPSPFGG